MKNKISKEQQQYLESVQTEATQIKVSRILLLAAFLVVWEVSSSIGLIDSFFLQ